MTILEVGKLYHPDRARWPEGGQFNYRGGQYELLLFYGQPTTREQYDIQRGDYSFAVLVEGDIVIFLYRFGGQNWADCPYSYWMAPEVERVPPAEVFPGSPLLQVALIDAEDGKVQALRAITLHESAARKLHKAIFLQSQNSPLSRADYDRQVNALYQHSTDQLLRRAKAQK